jgi:hypothetical protein
MTPAMRMYASRRAGRLALLVFSAFVGWFGIVGLMLVQGVEIAVYTARCGWLAMFRRAFPGETTQGAQS